MANEILSKPAAVCTKCGIYSYRFDLINENCEAEINGKTCEGCLGSALAPDDWKECPTCLNTGRKGPDACDACQGTGWIYVRKDSGNLIKEDQPVNFPEWFSKVKNELCHRTTRNGLRGIFKSGNILPNDGSFPDSFPKSKNSYGRINNLISLFDFKSVPEQELEIQFRDWYSSFFVNTKKRKQEPVSIHLILNRKMLAEKLISNAKAKSDRELSGERIQTIIRGVEAFYPEPIPCDAITGYLIICAVPGSLYDHILYKGPFPGIFDKINEFVEEHKKVYQEYEQSPEIQLEKALNKSKCDRNSIKS